ncbi:hypothetical protein N9166_01755 [bacterium]|nr:hypothetical protein [bacterium]
MSGGTLGEMERRTLEKKLPSYKVPGEFEARDDLTENGSGEIINRALR